MRKLSFAAHVLIAGALSQFSAFAQDTKKAEPLAAKVGSEKLTLEQLNTQRNEFLGSQGAATPSLTPEQAKRSFQLLRDQWVMLTLLSQAAENSKKDLEKDPAVAAALKRAVSQILMGAYVNKILKATITEASLKKAFEASQKNKTTEIKVVTLRAIFVDTEDTAKAIIKALQKNDKTFAELAKLRSIDKSSGSEGGLLPTTLESKLPESYQKALAVLKPQSFTEKPLPLGGKWCVLYLEKREPATFQQAESEVRDRVSREEMAAIVARLVKDKKYGVEFFDEAGQPTREISPLLTGGALDSTNTLGAANTPGSTAPAPAVGTPAAPAAAK